MRTTSTVTAFVALLLAASTTLASPTSHAISPRGPSIRSSTALIVDLDSGKELYSKDADRVRPVASLSKLMAAMVLLDAGIDLDGVQTIIKADRQAVLRGARSRLDVGSSFTNRDLLHAALMTSDNRAVVALGRYMGWTPERFASRMTRKARQMGLRNTSFADPTGLDDRNISTAREMLVILQESLKRPVICNIMKQESYMVTPVKGRHRSIEYRHTDHYARQHQWEIMGAKTGYTDTARYCLAISARLEGRNVGMVFLGAIGRLTRFADYSRAMHWLESRVSSPEPKTGTESLKTAQADNRDSLGRLNDIDPPIP